MREVLENHGHNNQPKKPQGPSLKTVLAIVAAMQTTITDGLASADDKQPQDPDTLEGWIQREGFEHAKQRAMTEEEVYLKFGHDPFAIPKDIESLSTANKIKLLAKLQYALMRNSHNKLHSTKEGGLYSPGISYDSLVFEIKDGEDICKLIIDKNFTDIKIVGDPNREISNLFFIKLIEHSGVIKA